ncbi:MAG: hypothetical protein HRT68_00585 [Flavobacteriaceae bacterium]|nr:hypothetical protein [Flavobacteriaceae bacterium]
MKAILYDAIEEKVPVIGVAKKAFHENTRLVIEVLRDENKNPFYVSSIGYHLDLAATQIKNMYREFRFPAIVKELYQYTKN